MSAHRFVFLAILGGTVFNVLSSASCTPPDTFPREEGPPWRQTAPVPDTGDAGDHADRDATPRDSKVEELSLAFCRRIFGMGIMLTDRCCTTSADRALEASGVAADSRSVMECSRLLVDSMSRGRIALDLASETACFAALDPAPIPCSARRGETQRAIGRVLIGDLPEACRSTYRGTVAAGSPCRWTDECTSGLVCGGGDIHRSIEGTCRVPGEADDPCETDGLELGTGGYSIRHTETGCGGGLRCAPSTGNSSSTGSCTPTSVPRDGQCTSSSSCVAGTTCTLGVCRPPRSIELGAPCGDGFACADGLICPLPEIDASSPRRTCRVRAAAGTDCSDDDDCLGRCDVATKVCTAHCGAS